MSQVENGNAELHELNMRRGTLKKQLTFFKNFINKLEPNALTNTDIRNLECRLNRIRDILEQFEIIQTEIEKFNLDSEANDLQREEFQDTYYSLIAEAEDILQKNNKGSILASNSSVHSETENNSQERGRNRASVKLPTIVLPSFDGNFARWMEFFDTFKSLVDQNQNLFDVEKLTYLKASLKGEPSNLLSSLEITDANYAVAWNLLTKRYNNTRRIINNHVQSILDMQNITRESHVALRDLINTVQKHVQCLKTLKQPVESWDAILVPIISKKLDINTLKDWEEKLNSRVEEAQNCPSLDEFLEFLNCKQNTLETVAFRQPNVNLNKLPQIKTKTFAAFNSHCSLCNGNNHNIYECQQFINFDVNTRNKKVRELKLCINCLRSSHSVSNCLSKSLCKKCGNKHHTILHFHRDFSEKKEGQPTPTTQNADAIKTSPNINRVEAAERATFNTLLGTNIINDFQPANESQVLLSTAGVIISDPININSTQTRALLDSASQSNFITEKLCQILNLKLSPIKVQVSGINKGLSQISYKTNVLLKSRLNNFEINITCLVIPKITSALPNQSFNPEVLKIPPNLKLADPCFNKSNEIDILLGAGIFYELLCIGQIKNKNLPILQKTKLGWVLSGPLNLNTSSMIDTNQSVSCLSLTEIDQNVRKFWDIDEFTLNKKILSKEEMYCEKYFADNTTRADDGKFIVKLPLKPTINDLGDSFEIAKSRLHSMENKLKSNPDIKEHYSDFIKEYVDLGHASVIKPDNTKSFFLPHHCVIKEVSETTKYRVVFDGSCKPNNGLSINEVQYTGPVLQEDIFSVISRFRCHEYVLTGDIEKMYRQIWLHPDHRCYQRILWRENPYADYQWIELNTVTYGLTFSAHAAVRCLFQIADDIKETYPVESNLIKKCFYMDDMLIGSNSVTELESFKNNITHILSLYGFPLRKFKSNVPHLTDKNQMNAGNLHLGENLNKTLGIWWDPNRDEITYKFNITNREQVSKRTILATVSQLYDPLGFLAPVVILAKFIIQELWKLNLKWDESIPLDLHTKWISLKKKLIEIDKIRVSRKIIITKAVKVELHVFCDASEKGYGSCIYVRSVDVTNQVCVKLLAAKSRVAPIKNSTLPRLELNAALLGADLAHKFKDILDIPIDRTYYYTDSQIVIAWIKSEPHRWKTFVANRVVEIQNLSDPQNWFHVKSSQNPADIISRGMMPDKLLNSSLWWYGPEYLSDASLSMNSNDAKIPKVLPEEKTKPIVVISTQIIPSRITYLLDKVSSFKKLVRILAWCVRFATNTKLKGENKISGNLKMRELENATNLLIKFVQTECFSKDLQQLSREKDLNRKSNLLSLSPFIDAEGILRVGGRLSLSNVPYNKKHPILLPKGHVLAKMICKDYHEQTLHAGPKLLLSTIREKYWPLDGKNLVKKCIKSCIQCFRFNTKPEVPIMAALPKYRTEAVYPFYSTGVDFAGPYLLKNKTGRGSKVTKCYISLFVCFATKALHLELLTSLSTDAFLSVLRRFISRRGKPAHVFSDNGTNFIGCANELSKIYEFLSRSKDDITNKSMNQGVQWHFIPPNSPHFGGLWEAGVKTVKYHLKRVLTSVPLVFEDFYTILNQIESVVNSRPLTSLSDDPNDCEALTPAHFLIGRTFTSIPQPDFLNVPTNRLSRYEQLQKITQHFWMKWHKEYLHELQVRQKWKNTSSTVKNGTLVLVKEDNSPPASWKLARIQEVHPGPDNTVRVVTLKFANGASMKRPVTKICPLPIEEN